MTQTAHSSAYGTLTSTQGSSNKTQQCNYCKEWKSVSSFEMHLKACALNNKENSNEASDQMMQTNVLSTRKNSLLQTLNLQQQNPKQKRINAFKQQQKEHLESSIHPIDLNDLKDPQMCAEYVGDIFEWLRTTETEPGNNNSVNPTYMTK